MSDLDATKVDRTKISDHTMNESQFKEPTLEASMPQQTSHTLWKIFISAVAIRWGYDIALYTLMGRDGLMGADSYGYLAGAEAMAKDLLNGTLRGWAWLGSDLGVMPLYPWFLTLNVVLFGSLASLTSAMMQGLIDGATCLLIFQIAKSIDPRAASPAAIAAAINPTQIVVSGLIYNDTIFVFFAVVSLWAGLAWIARPAWSLALMATVGLGLAALDRIVIAPWVPVFACALLALRFFAVRLRPGHAVQMAIVGIVFCVIISPLVGRNVSQFGSWSLTPQAGGHLALWVVPLVREAKDGTLWEKGSAEMERVKIARYGPAPRNPFVNSQQFAEIGREELGKLGMVAVATAWIRGAVINLVAPAVVISPPVARLPRTGFFSTPGNSLSGKVVNFLFHSDNARFAWILIVGIAGLGLVRAIQLLGFGVAVTDRAAWPALAVMILWTGFILAANGPIASPKYRLPIEPVLCVLTGIGLSSIGRKRERRIASA